MDYTVSKEKGGRWYCHPVGDAGHPIQYFGDKKKAFNAAAKMNEMTVKQFLKERKSEDGR